MELSDRPGGDAGVERRARRHDRTRSLTSGASSRILAATASIVKTGASGAR